jgi:hypothetical protein
MVRLPILLILALQCFTTTACHSEKTAPSNSLRFVVQRDSIVDFYGFLEAIKLLVSQRGSSLELTIGPNDKRLSFISVNGFPGDPVMIHVSPDQVAIGSGPSRQQLTVEHLRKQLNKFSDAASKAESKGMVLLISDRRVSGEFGLEILDAIIDSGIAIVMLSDPDLYEAPVPMPSKKPSSPFGRQQEAEQAGTGQPATRPESKSEGSDKPQPDAEGRSR